MHCATCVLYNAVAVAALIDTIAKHEAGNAKNSIYL